MEIDLKLILFVCIVIIVGVFLGMLYEEYRSYLWLKKKNKRR